MLQLDVRLTLETDDKQMIYMTYKGFRHGPNGRMIPRDIITSFSCRYNGEEIFSTLFYPAIAANPFMSFYTVATESGTVAFSWTDQHGEAQVQTAPITVE